MDLDLDLDLDLEDDEAPAETAGGAASPAGKARGVIEEKPGADLDMDDAAGQDELDLDLGTAADDAVEDELGLDFDLDFDEKKAAPATSQGDGLDLDLDLEDTAAAGKAGEGEDDFDLDFDLELVEEPVSNRKTPAGDDELQLDFDGLEKMVESQDGAKVLAEAPGQEELDLSELEDFLDEGTDAGPVVAGGAASDLDLDLDFAADATSGGRTGAAGLDAGDIDLTDVEDLLADDSGTQRPRASAGKPAPPSAVPDESLSLPPDLDLDEVNLSLDDNEDMKLDFGVDDVDVSAMTEADMDFAGNIGIPPQGENDANASAADVAAAAGEAIAAVGEEPEKSGKKAARTKKKKKKTQGVRKKKSKLVPALVVLLLVLIAGAGGLYYVVTVMNIPIPYVSDILNPQPADPMGTLKMATQGEAVSRFMENTAAGRLLIITGKVKNDYREARRNVRMVGRLFAKGKKLLQVQTAYAGNIIADQDLMTEAFPGLRKRLLNRARSRVAPGGVIPYMLVFDKLPQNLDEFTVEVAGSQASGANP